MKRIAAILFFCCTICSVSSANNSTYNGNDVIDDISTCLRNANTKELSKYFSSTVSMSLINDEGVYSKVQAEIILREFFNRNQPTDVSIIQRLDSNPSFRFIVIQMTTSRRNYRISYKLVSDANSLKITELRID